MLRLIEAPHHFRVSLNGHLVESSQDEFEASSRASSRMTQTGYYTHAVESDYEKNRYLSNRPLTTLVFKDGMPLTQCDLLYARKKWRTPISNSNNADQY
jgi:hypothetical protein